MLSVTFDITNIPAFAVPISATSFHVVSPLALYFHSYVVAFVASTSNVTVSPDFTFAVATCFVITGASTVATVISVSAVTFAITPFLFNIFPVVVILPVFTVMSLIP